MRIAAPVVAGQALAATVGAGATAELGAMRISEEIDALEVMGIKSISYLVSTRIMAGFVVIIPLYAMAIDHVVPVRPGHHDAVLRPVDRHLRALLPHVPAPRGRVLVVRARSIIISVIVMLNHCYYGYYASGGPVGVGEAVGRSMRASLVAIVLVVLFASLALYGVDPNFNLTV